jgi:hypothetical protein
MTRFLIGAITVAFLGCVGPFSEDFESQYSDVNAARADDSWGSLLSRPPYTLMMIIWRLRES